MSKLTQKEPRKTHTRTLMSLAALPLAVVLSAVMVSPDSRRSENQAAADSVASGDVALGKKVFEGKSGGALCAACHGPQARGLPGMGPDLTDKTWLHGDGSPEFLRTIIRSGVTNPKKSAAMMPPMGGGQLTPEHVEGLVAYLTSLQKK